MREIALTEEQRRAILDGLATKKYESGSFALSFSFEDFTVEATGAVDYDGYTEQDTNGFIETYRSAYVELTGSTEDNEDVTVDGESERIFNDYLNKH